MWKSYLLLIVLTILFSALSFVFKDEWVGSYLSNIAAGILGSLLIIFLVDRIIERNRKKERFRVVGIALQRLSISIIRQMTLLCNIYKAATRNKPTRLPSTFEDAFNDNYYKEISYLDFTKDAPVVPKRDWFTHLYLMTKSFREKIEQIIDTYGFYLDVSLIDLLERIVNSHFIHIIPQLRNLPAVDRQLKFKRVYTMFSGIEDFVKEHVSLMEELVEYCNSYSDIPIRLNQDVWRDDVAPKRGSARAETTEKLERI